jgi:tricorn protease-like protein
MAPGLVGKKIDLRRTPEHPHFLDHAVTLLDPNRELEWVTAINPKKRLIIGYIFKRADYPWLQYWGYYPPTQKMARGMEFATQPYDVPRREAISTGKMFDTPTYRWLPAKSKIKTRFLLFYAHVPEGFNKVDDVTMENGRIVITDRSAKKKVELAAAEKL